MDTAFWIQAAISAGILAVGVIALVNACAARREAADAKDDAAVAMDKATEAIRGVETGIREARHNDRQVAAMTEAVDQCRDILSLYEPNLFAADMDVAAERGRIIGSTLRGRWEALLPPLFLISLDRFVASNQVIVQLVRSADSIDHLVPDTIAPVMADMNGAFDRMVELLRESHSGEQRNARDP